MGLLDWLSPSPVPSPETVARIGRAIDAIEPRIRLVGGYERRLAPAVERAGAYCAALAERIPGPVTISRGAFAADPLVHALFGSAEDIGTMFATSQCVRDHLAGLPETAGSHCCALLGMRRREKAGFGVAVTGDVLRQDEPQRTLYFADHTLAEPAADVAAARRRLAGAMFQGLLQSIAFHVDEVRREMAGLRQDSAIEGARVRALDGPEAHTRHLDDLRRRLRATADALSPASLLETLADSLAEPERHLSLEPLRYAVDRAGIIAAGPAAAGTVDSLEFAELCSRDQRRWIVVLASIDHAEAREALVRLDAARRYMLL
ncbi:MAG: hypothetical protein JNK22_12880 [Rhodocyclaceae bacterium]|nr:hypothetical protein [Rhodocyclaceae bacterium]